MADGHAYGLVHSPVAGPSTWAPVAGELGARGIAVAVLLDERGRTLLLHPVSPPADAENRPADLAAIFSRLANSLVRSFNITRMRLRNQAV